jgi:hypothetical protein
LKLARLLLLALLVLAMLNVGCVGFIRDTYKDVVATPTPSPGILPAVTSTPISQAVEKQYMFRENLVAGYEHYNNGIEAFNVSRSAYERSDWANATLNIGMAKSYMGQASSDFLSMKPYAQTPDAVLVSDKWNETAYYLGQAFYYVNLSYQEGSYQASRSFAEQNPVKYNAYLEQAKYYQALAAQSRAEAEAAEGRTFIGQQGEAT